MSHIKLYYDEQKKMKALREQNYSGKIVSATAIV